MNPLNPLTPFTYYRRHKGQALLLLVLIGSLTLGVHAMVSLSEVVYGTFDHAFHHLTRMSQLSSSGGPMAWLLGGGISAGGTLDASFVAQIRAHPDVTAVIPENGMYVSIPMGIPVPFPVLGVTEADLPALMEACDLQLKSGRLIRPRAGEIVLSEELVRALDLQIGDHIGYETNADYFSTMATELTLVGILESVPSGAGPEVRTGFVSYEYLEGHELYQPRTINWLVISRPGRRMAVNDLIEGLIAESAGPPPGHLETFESATEYWDQMHRISDAIFGFMDGLVAVAAALVVGMVHRIAITHRLPELGLLYATGYRRRGLVRRLVLEVATIACAGWTIGLLCAYGLVILLNGVFFVPHGLSANLADPTPLFYTLPVPLVVVVWIHVSVNRTLNHLDPVAIIERGKLSMEGAGSERQAARGKGQRGTHSSHNPLSSWTFYLRHRRRSMWLVVAIGSMVLSVALPAFYTAIQQDALLPYYVSYTSHTPVVSPGYAYRAVPADVAAQIRAHPAVAHAIPVKPLSMVFNLPTAGEMLSLAVYAVREQDLPILLDVYDLHLAEGELVRPQSSHIVLTSALARNRNLRLGDAIGQPVHERDGMPTELTIVGLLESTNPALVDRAGYDVPLLPRWVGFASYEYVDGHERYAGTPTHLLIVPAEGHRTEVEVWLEETIVSPRVRVGTLGTSYGLWFTTTRFMLLSLVITECILAAVAAGALAILNYLFVIQRRDEFGVLHAVGHSRADLIRRTLRESMGTAGAAWLIGAAICIVAMYCGQVALYTPLGTSLDWTNPIPWLYTLPIPLAVVAASAGTIAWALSRLDPVAVIERR